MVYSNYSNKYLSRETQMGGSGEHTGFIKHDLELRFEPPHRNGIPRTMTTTTPNKKRTTARFTWLIGITLMASMFVLAGCVEITTGEGSGEGMENENQKHTFQVGENPTIDISGFNGSIEIIAGDAGVVDVEATLRLPNRISYSAERNGNTVTVTAKKTGVGFIIGRSPAVEIKIVVPSHSTLKARTSNGSIEVVGITGSGDLDTSNGRITLTDVDGEFEANTSNGTIGMSVVNGEFNVESSNGKIEFEGTFAADSDNSFQTSNGSIDVVLTGAPNLEIDARTSNGTTSSDIPILATTTEKNHLAGKFGAGSASLELKTSNGSIKLR